MFIRTKKKKACFLPKIFEPRGVNDLIRLGSDHDGGYVVSADAVASTRHMLSLGLGYNCDFPYDLAAMGRLDSLTCYDASIDPDALRRRFLKARLLSVVQPDRHRRFLEYYKQYKSLFDSGRPGFAHLREDAGMAEGMVSPAETIGRIDPGTGRLFLKVDVGGREYDFLDQIIEANETLSGLVIVFHSAVEHMREIEVFVSAMREFMTIDNTAADNTAGLTGIGSPNRIEMSFSAKFASEPHIPIAGASTRYKVLTAPNDPNLTEYEIFYVE
ncbi:hypothetical protein [Oricola thermophila]|uniref:Methyltransferase FkbM domain-containing protein n=1 Tax=Oricola thermophila TaxID=2742145 RepID=A0A6N1VIK2_9HYPH|nr:hypothetical protein [Oricola thermophila]QKV18817.1 hypothetical protein HTY61_10320 [Oricola thermophila]